MSKTIAWLVDIDDRRRSQIGNGFVAKKEMVHGFAPNSFLAIFDLFRMSSWEIIESTIGRQRSRNWR
jgi:hypothetical protein